MSQYKTGTATVTNGSATVTGTNTLWLANVSAGDSFTVAGDGVMYDVASVDSDTQVTLSVAYAGVTASGAVYAIGTGFTVPDSFPEMSQGDIETATIFTRAMRGVQGKFSGIVSTIYGLAYPSTTLASSSDISESVEPAIAAYPHIQGFRTGTGTALTFAQVVEEAAERGARLLTIQELEAGVAAGAGFSYDPEITWTSSPAGVGLVYGNLGDGDGTRVVLNTNTDTAAGGYAVSVIGQRQWTDTQYSGLDGGANANFTTMPQVGGDPIVESGSNADGEWTRWADGTQAVFFRPWALTNSSPKDATRTFPAAFVDTDYIISLSYGNTVVANLSGTYVGTDSSQNATTSARFYGESVFSGGGTWTAHTTILGRYK
jgi:hypothetical protein